MATVADIIEAEILLRRDSLTPALEKISGLAVRSEQQLKKLEKTLGIIRPPAGFNKFTEQLLAADKAGSALRVTLGAIELQPAAAGEASALSRALGTADRNAAALARNLARVKAESHGLGNLPLPGAGDGSGHGGGRGGLSTRFHSGPVGGHLGIGVGEAVGLGAGFGAYRGLKLAGNEELAYTYAQLAAGVDPSSKEGVNYHEQLRRAAEAASVGTVFSRADVAKMMPGTAGMADVPLKEALPFMAPAIQFGEIEKQFGAAMGKHFEAHESAAAAIRMSHMFGITDPKAMGPVLNALVPATTTADKSPSDLVNILQYMTGSASGVGMSNAEALNLGTLGSILAPGTRAGTSLNMMLTGLMPSAGPGAGTKIQRKAAARRAELVKMGLISPKTGRLFQDEHGGMVVPLLENLHKYQTEHPKEAYAAFVRHFQQRGARIAWEMARNPKMVAMEKELEERQRSFTAMGGVQGVQGKQNETLNNQTLRVFSQLGVLVIF